MINCNSLIYFVAMETTCVLLGVFHWTICLCASESLTRTQTHQTFPISLGAKLNPIQKYGKLNKLVWIGRSLFSTFAMRLKRTSELNANHHRASAYTLHAHSYHNIRFLHRKKENFPNNLLAGKWYRVSSIYDYDCVRFFSQPYAMGL